MRRVNGRLRESAHAAGTAEDSRATTEGVTTVLPAVPPSVGAARRFVTAAMRRHNALPETIDVACLLTSELVTNALVHAQSRVKLTVLVGAAHFRVEVGDTSGRAAHRREIEPDAVNGRGLQIVDAMSSRWGTGSTADGKRVWFELDAPYID